MNGVNEATAPPAPVDLRNASFDGILPGRYALEYASQRPDGSPRVFSCRTQRISTDMMTVEAPICGSAGERVKAWIEHFELVTGTVCNIADRAFGIRLQLSPRAQIAFANRILWVREHVEEGVPDLRGSKRLPMPSLKPILILGNGHVEDCFIIDASVKGAAISADLQLKNGTRLALGCIVGTVVRQIETGFAIKFDDEQDPDGLRQVLGWRPPKLR